MGDFQRANRKLVSYPTQMLLLKCNIKYFFFLVFRFFLSVHLSFNFENFYVNKISHTFSFAFFQRGIRGSSPDIVDDGMGTDRYKLNQYNESDGERCVFGSLSFID